MDVSTGEFNAEYLPIYVYVILMLRSCGNISTFEFGAPVLLHPLVFGPLQTHTPVYCIL
jgi:hypothetical protein